MKIALAHFRVGETDGVSLEMDKWKYMLEQSGHECMYIAGSQGNVKATVIDELHYQGKENNRFVQNCYREMTDYSDEEVLKEDIFAYAKMIEDKLVEIIKENHIDVVIPNNIWSLGWHLPAGIAFTNAAKRCRDVQFIGHNHDFYWERILYSNPKVSFVKGILEEYFVPNLPNVKHCVINKIAQTELKKRRGIESVVVPNVFDFSQDVWKKDEYNKDLREKLDIDENDIVFLQATRVTERKGIEFAVQVIDKIEKIKKEYIGRDLYNGKRFTENSKIHFVMTGLNESPVYLETIKRKLEEKEIQYHYINHMIDHSRYTKEDGTKVYSLWDTYVLCDFVTYPSILEGWGNQLLEAMFAKKPVMVYEYPVFLCDLKQSGINYVSLGHEYSGNEGDLSISELVAEHAAEETMRILFDTDKYNKMINANFEIGRTKYSYEALGNILKNMI